MRSYLSLILVLCLLMMSVACTQTPAAPADDFSDTLLPADLPVPSRENPFFLQPYNDLQPFYQKYCGYKGYIVGADQFDSQDLHTFSFPSDTIFIGAEALTQEILEAGMDPGLGIRVLHDQGITGKGVNVAIIDQKLLPDHPEYAHAIAAYYETDTNAQFDEGSMHGPAVLSLLAGKNCGTAPEAKVWFAAGFTGELDATDPAEALWWIIEQNRALPEGEKIRVVSVSAGPQEGYFAHAELWTEAVSVAQSEGILVIDCREIRDTGFVHSAYYDRSAPDDPEKSTPGYPNDTDISLYLDDYFDGMVFAPASFRTFAQTFEEGEYFYKYMGAGGQSWAVPYVAGVLALGFQVNPNLDSAAMKSLLFDSCVLHETGRPMLDPTKFIQLVKATLP